MPHLDDLIIRIYPEISVVDETGKLHPLSSFDHKTCSYNPILINVFEINGTFYQGLPDGNFSKIDPISDSEVKTYLTTSWLYLPETLRVIYIEDNYPNCNTYEFLTTLYGKEKGQEMIEESDWLLNHTVYTTEITVEIKEKIGKFDKVKELQSDYVFPNDTDFDNSKWYQYLIDDRWIVTVTEHSNPFKNLDYDMLPKKVAVLMEKFAELSDVTVNIVDLNK